MPMNRCDCNQTFRRDILLLVTHTTTGIAITSARSPSLRSPSATYRTKPAPIQRLPPFSDARANGLNQTQILKSPSLSIPRTQTFFLTSLSTTWRSATLQRLTSFLIGQLRWTHNRLLHTE